MLYAATDVQRIPFLLIEYHLQYVLVDALLVGRVRLRRCICAAVQILMLDLFVDLDLDAVERLRPHQVVDDPCRTRLDLWQCL